MLILLVNMSQDVLLYDKIGKVGHFYINSGDLLKENWKNIHIFASL